MFKIMQKSKIKKEPSKNSTTLLLGLPGPGLIGTMAITYITHSLKMDLIGEIESSPASIVFVDNGQIVGPVRIYKKDKTFAILSDIPVDYDNVVDFVESVIDFSKRNNIGLIIFSSGIHMPDRNVATLKTYG